MKVAVKAAVSLGLLALLFFLLPWDQVRDALTRLPLVGWIGVFAGFVLGHAIGVVKWRLFTNAARAGLGLTDAALCYCAGLFANICLPSIVGGDILRMGLAAKYTKRPEAALWGGVMDRVTDMIALAILVTIGGLLARNALDGWTGQVLTVGLVAGIGILALAVPFALRRPLARWPKRLRRPVGRGLVGLRRLWRTPTTAALGLGLSLLIQSTFVLLNAGLGRAVGIDVGVAVWFLVWPLAKVAGLMPISLGGLAVREGSLAALLLPFGVPFALSVVGALLWQTVMIAGGLVGGLVWFILGRIRPAPLTPANGPMAAKAWGN